MTVFFQQVITGLSIGSIYALLAVGYSLIFSIFRFSNFAFGIIMMVGTFAAFFAINLLGVPLLISIVIALVCGAAFSLLIEMSVYKPMRNKKTSRLFLMIAGIGMNTFIENLGIQVFGGGVKPFPSDWASEVAQIGDVVAPRSDIFAAVLSLLMMVCMTLFFYKTRIGLGIRASSFDTRTAELMGLNVNLLSFAVFAMSGVTAGLAGVFYGMKYCVYPSMGLVSNKAFVAAVVGGLGSMPGAVLGGFVLGFLETMISGYISSRLRDLVAYAVLIIVLLFMPEGLLGKNVKAKI